MSVCVCRGRVRRREARAHEMRREETTCAVYWTRTVVATRRRREESRHSEVGTINAWQLYNVLLLFLVTEAKPVGSNWKMHEENSFIILRKLHVEQILQTYLLSQSEMLSFSVIIQRLRTLTEQPNNPPEDRNVHIRVAIQRYWFWRPSCRWRRGNHLVWDRRSVDSSFLFGSNLKWRRDRQKDKGIARVCTNLHHHSISFFQRTSVSTVEILSLGSRDKSKNENKQTNKDRFSSLFHDFIIERKARRERYSLCFQERMIDDADICTEFIKTEF